jgi:hypothetical protein
VPLFHAEAVLAAVYVELLHFWVSLDDPVDSSQTNSPLYSGKDENQKMNCETNVCDHLNMANHARTSSAATPPDSPLAGSKVSIKHCHKCPSKLLPRAMGLSWREIL